MDDPHTDWRITETDGYAVLLVRKITSDILYGVLTNVLHSLR